MSELEDLHRPIFGEPLSFRFSILGMPSESWRFFPESAPKGSPQSLCRRRGFKSRRWHGAVCGSAPSRAGSRAGLTRQILSFGRSTFGDSEPPPPSTDSAPDPNKVRRGLPAKSAPFRYAASPIRVHRPTFRTQVLREYQSSGDQPYTTLGLRSRNPGFNLNRNPYQRLPPNPRLAWRGGVWHLLKVEVPCVPSSPFRRSG